MAFKPGHDPSTCFHGGAMSASGGKGKKRPPKTKPVKPTGDAWKRAMARSMKTGT